MGLISCYASTSYLITFLLSYAHTSSNLLLSLLDLFKILPVTDKMTNAYTNQPHYFILTFAKRLHKTSFKKFRTNNLSHENGKVSGCPRPPPSIIFKDYSGKVIV